MTRYLFALSLAAATLLGCVNLSDTSTQELLVVAPILDSVFVGDTLPPRDVYLKDANGVHHDPGAVIWSVSPTSVATIDATGRVAGKSKGTAVVFAQAQGALSAALVIVSRPLEMTPLMDTIYVMPGDTITVPLAFAQKTPGPTTLRFDSSAAPSVYTIDTLTGLVTAHADGVVRYAARLTDGTNTALATGAVVVMSLTDTTSSSQGRFFMTAFGTAIRHQSGGALALNYARLNGKLAFRLVDTLVAGDSVNERVLITLPDSVLPVQIPGSFEIDSISPQEANSTISTLNPTCSPKRPWAFFGSLLPSPGVIAYSHGTPTDPVAGSLSITQYAPAAGGGAIISGRYLFRAQRIDLYGDPLGSETIRGTFVAPLRERHTTCQG